MPASLPNRLAADIGGTFTDIVLERGTERRSLKLLTTPKAPEEAVIDGTSRLLEQEGLSFSDISLFVHGTTLATNALIERKGALTALITTEGFRDVIEIGDEGRYDQYDIYIDKPVPLVERSRRFTVPERMDVHGKVRLPLDVAAAERIAGEIDRLAIEAVAVTFMHAYANDAHERTVRDILARHVPHVAVTLSSEVCPEAREYERASTAIANAYVQPLMAGYLARLEEGFRRMGYTAPIHLMTSAGSLASIETARRFPVRLVESGPAGGAILAARIAAERQERQVISFDMGGTTAKICLIEDYAAHKGRTFEVDRAARFLKGSGLPLRIPVVEMIEIGAGGGSIARVDTLKRLSVGPQSAASLPGPACYGRGGSEPTVTDADLVLGRIDPEFFAGGKIRLDSEAARRAVADVVGRPLGLETGRAAYGVSEIVDENMANAARVHSVERGQSASDHVLIAFGGAAPLHAARLAEKLAIDKVIVPRDAGVGSAIGFLLAPAAYEMVQSRFMRLESFDASAANDLLAMMAAEASDHAAMAAGGASLAVRRQAFMRYRGQGHEIAVTLPDRRLATEDAVLLRQAFETAYAELFTRHIPGAAIEILSWSVFCASESAEAVPLPAVHSGGTAKPQGSRDLFDAATGGVIKVSVFHRARLAAGLLVEGPAIIVEDGTSTLVTASFDACIDAGGALVLTRKEMRHGSA